ncbi:histidine biosynthesis protein [Methanohalobium evestigatum Z-7303]|uniref:Histidine biosynthesis protein n=1 Tax=Methanohalobium evestigatum (strain ATCC BAA-1072 / DSM 3721 / NBRC 107634 / OCM 161 / Z-7303) TaxID=644295 RepID=D7E7G7_METEZ|nr:HisA/HisF-related TIM barrel protein [Methanohalobium evestigatum]ADI73916.1 histidine biosynthesis protein [Methanohalobium evestigatum Z-7303]
MFRMVLVLDIYNRNVVHAKGGDRKHYHPINQTSKICNSSNPIEIIETVRPKEVYAADLNILQGTGSCNTNYEVISSISEKTSTMVDMGITSFNDISDALSIADKIVLGTETASIDVISKAAYYYPGRINVSIDKKDNKILKTDPDIPDNPFEIIKILNDVNIQDVIVLDMDSVGTSSGVDSEFLSNVVSCSKHDILLGGGVRDVDDIETLKNAGVKGALVATALHNRSIPVEMVR